MQNQTITLCCLICLATPSFAFESPVGKTVSQAAQMLKVDLESGAIIDEPPAVARGIEFKSRDRVEVQVFIERGQVPLTFKGGDNLMLFKDLKVIGFRHVENGKVYCEGAVLWQYLC